MSTCVVNTPEEFVTAIFDGMNGYPPIAIMPNRNELLLKFFDGIFAQAYAKESELRQHIKKLEAENRRLKKLCNEAADTLLDVMHEDFVCGRLQNNSDSCEECEGCEHGRMYNRLNSEGM